MNGKKEQIRNSKRKIVEATFQLLTKNSLTELTLNEILDESGISRRTFYRYFQNKQSIIDYYCDTFVETYRLQEKLILKQTSFEGVLTVTLNYFKANQPELRLLISNQLFYLLLSKFNDAAITIYQSINAPWHIQMDSTQKLNDILLFIVGGYFNIISHWLLDDHPKETREIALDIKNLFFRIANSFNSNSTS